MTTPTPQHGAMPELPDAEFDALHGGRELLPIEQLVYEAEGADRFARFHEHGRSFHKSAEFSESLT